MGLSADKIELLLNQSPIGFIKEYEFDKHFGGRKWKNDFCIPKYGIVIEFEGLNLYAKSRHTSITGYTNDLAKYNQIQKLGFRLLRYSQLSEESEVIQDLETLVQTIETNHSFFSGQYKCEECNEILYYPPSLFLPSRNNEGYMCLTCRWIIDDRNKVKKKTVKAQKNKIGKDIIVTKKI